MKRRNSPKRDLLLTNAVRSSRSIAGVLRSLGLYVGGSNYDTIRRGIRTLQLDTSHWTGQGHRKGSREPVVPPWPLDRVLTRNSTYHTNRLRERLLAEGVFKARCTRCLLSEWQGFDIPLELHHEDGNPKNHSIENLRLLCNNCHALTPNWRGRVTRGRGRFTKGIRRSAKICPGGGTVYTRGLKPLAARHAGSSPAPGTTGRQYALF